VTAEPLLGPQPLDSSHELGAFDCGAPALNEYLHRWALVNQHGGKSRTYVAARGSRVVAYHSLAAASVRPIEGTERLRKGQGRGPIPVILLGRLAVDIPEQGHGLGTQMLLDALRRSAAAAEAIGARAVFVQAKHEIARSFYAKFGFEPAPMDPLRLFLLMKDIRKTLGQPSLSQRAASLAW